LNNTSHGAMGGTSMLFAYGGQLMGHPMNLNNSNVEPITSRNKGPNSVKTINS
jgi:hypothetical protein